VFAAPPVNRRCSNGYVFDGSVRGQLRQEARFARRPQRSHVDQDRLGLVNWLHKWYHPASDDPEAFAKVCEELIFGTIFSE
jgi:hypothetical protein